METPLKSSPMKVEIIQHIRSHNKPLTEEVLKEFSLQQLLCEVHPNYFDYFVKRFSDQDKGILKEDKVVYA